MEYLVLLLALFVISLFLGVELINKVPPNLHTPLMSGCNAISGITMVGAVLAAGAEQEITPLIGFLGFVALVLSTTNVVAGFMVTHRMLAMFTRRSK